MKKCTHLFLIGLLSLIGNAQAMESFGLQSFFLLCGLGHGVLLLNLGPFSKALVRYAQEKQDIMDITVLSTDNFREISLEKIKKLIELRNNDLSRTHDLLNKLVHRFGNKAPLKCAQVIELLLKKGVQPFNAEQKYSFFHDLIVNNCVEIVKYFLENDVPFLGSDDYKNSTTRSVLLEYRHVHLLDACEKGHRALVELLLKWGIKIDATVGNYEKTSVKEAFLSDNEKIALALIHNGVLVDYGTQEAAESTNNVDKNTNDLIKKIIEFESKSQKEQCAQLINLFENGNTYLFERCHYISGINRYLYAILEKHAQESIENIMKKCSFGRTVELKRLGLPLDFGDYKNKQKFGLFESHPDVLFKYIAF